MSARWSDPGARPLDDMRAVADAGWAAEEKAVRRPGCGPAFHVPGVFEFRDSTRCYVRSCLTCEEDLVVLAAEVVEDERLFRSMMGSRPRLAEMLRQAIVRQREREGYGDSHE